MKLITIIILSLSLAACSACRSKPAANPDKGNSVTVTVDGPRVITTTKDANGKLVTITTQPTPPDNYPKDIPTFAEGHDSTYGYSSEGGHITLQSLASKGAREVAEYFEHELSASGWTSNITTGQDKVSLVKADKDGRHIEIAVSPFGTGSKVELSYNAAS